MAAGGKLISFSAAHMRSEKKALHRQEENMKSGILWIGLLVGLIITAGVDLFILPMIGVFDMTATGNNNILDWCGKTNLESTLDRRSPETTLPATVNINEGFELYRSTCLHCHGARNASREQWAQSMSPKPPKLWEKEFGNSPDGELWYTIKNGIRMSGMPAFGPSH